MAQAVAFTAPTRRALVQATLAMAAVVLASNILVQFPINDWLTWGAITYPFAFLVSELANRAHGPGHARRIAWVGFAVAVAASLLLAPLRIAVASGAAFLCSQLLDIQVFDRLRRLRQWWIAPTCSTVFGSLVDTFVFFSVAFWHSSDPFMAEHWVEIATVDYGVKLAVSLLLFVPLYGVLLNAILRVLAGRDNTAQA